MVCGREASCVHIRLKVFLECLASRSHPSQSVRDRIVFATHTPKSNLNIIFTFVLVNGRVEDLEKVGVLRSPLKLGRVA
jgi:hypothetical protein